MCELNLVLNFRHELLDNCRLWSWKSVFHILTFADYRVYLRNFATCILLFQFFLSTAKLFSERNTGAPRHVLRLDQRGTNFFSVRSATAELQRLGYFEIRQSIQISPNINLYENEINVLLFKSDK